MDRFRISSAVVLHHLHPKRIGRKFWREKDFMSLVKVEHVGANNV